MNSQIETYLDESRRNCKSKIVNPLYAARYSLYAVFLYLLIAAFCTPKSAFAASSIVGWGGNHFGQASPPTGTDFVAIAAESDYSLALKSYGSIVGWGRNDSNQASPPVGTYFVAIATGEYHSLALKSDGSIVGWGSDIFGQASPPAGTNFVAIAAGSEHSLALKSDGSIVGWGLNGDGQVSPPAGTDFVAIAAGSDHSLALKSDGSIVGWGQNDYGQASPPAGTDFVAIAAGWYHNLALKSDGSIVGWGFNEDWNGNWVGQASPPAGTDFVAVAAGSAHSLALKLDGSIVGWGWNDSGQASPPAGTDFVAIAAGYGHSLALKADAELKHFEINQCFQEVEVDGKTQKYELIETKPFVARVALEKQSEGSTNVKVKLAVFNTDSGEQIGKSKEKKATIEYDTPETVDFIFIDSETKYIKAGNYRFHLVVEDDNAVILLQQSPIYQFKSSKTVRMLTVQYLLFNLQIGVWNDSYISFTEKVFPVPKTTATSVNRLKIAYKPFLVSGLSLNLLLLQMHTSLLQYNLDHLLAPADFICAVVPDGVLPGNAAGLRLGSAVVIESRNDSQYILGHETGHIYGLGEEYIHSEPKTNGLWILDETFYFDRNPPPLKLNPNGLFIIATQRPYAGQRCDWAEDTNSYDNPVFYFDKQGNWRWWCTGRYVGQGGYDVLNQREVSSSTFSMMSAANGSAWISGPEYRSLISQLVQNQLELSSTTINISSGQTRVIISGIVDIMEKSAELSPLIPAPNLEPTPDAEDPNCQLMFMSQAGTVLGTFWFSPLESELPGSQLKGPFCVIVDLPLATVRIQVTIDGIVIAELQLTDNSPTVQVLSPNGGEEISGEMVITWSASDPNDEKLYYTVEFSNNNGVNWNIITTDYKQTELTIDSNYLPGGPNCLIKVVASDGWNRSQDVSDGAFSITTKPPEITILDPLDGAILLQSESLQGRCAAYDPETADITDPNAVVWISDVNGFLGNGNLLSLDLSLGEHLLSATVTDPEGKTATDTVNVTVVANLADFNYDRRVDFFDLAEFANRWQATCTAPNWCERVDFDYSGTVDSADLAELVDNWLWQQD